MFILKFLLLLVSFYPSLGHTSPPLSLIKQTVEPESLDPHQARRDEEKEILSDLFMGLVQLNENSEVTPGVAHQWEISKDGLTYTFHLQPSQWSNGDPVTAEDFVYSFRRLLLPETQGPLSSTMKPIKNAAALLKGDLKDPTQLGVKALDAQTLVIELESPTPYFMELLTCHCAYPLHRKTVEKHGAQWTRPENTVINGPYILKEWLPNHHLALEKNQTYKGPAPSFEKVVYRPVSSDIALNMFRSGDLHVCSFDSEKIDWIGKTMSQSLRLSPGLGVYYVGINTTRPGLSDKKLRQALCLAIDREVITSKIKRCGETPAYRFLMPKIRGRDSAPAWYESFSSAERLQKAKALYAEAQKPEKNTVTLLVTPVAKNMAVVFADMWQKAFGLKVQIEVKEWKTFSVARKQKNYDLFFAGWSCDFNDPINVLDAYDSGASHNLTGYENPAFDELLKKAALCLNPTERYALLNQADGILCEDLPAIPVYYYSFSRLASPEIKGPIPNLWGISPTAQLHWEKVEG